MPRGEIYRGHVNWFSAPKGYGFITCEQLGRDVFVHFQQIISDATYRSLNQGQLVEFELVTVPKGVEAGNVRVLEEMAAAQ